jgi:cyclin-C
MPSTHSSSRGRSPAVLARYHHYLRRRSFKLTSLDVLSSDTSQLGECEFSIISELNSQLIVHHPYRSLTELQSQLGLTLDETSLAWNIINDHYLTNIPLLYAPHVIALTAVLLAVVMKPQTQGTNIHAGAVQNAMQTVSMGQQLGPRVQKILNWIAESSVKIEDMAECMQELISLYDIWDGYKESLCKDPLARFVKARGLEN